MSSVKGLLVEIGGDTSKLQSALKNVDKTTGSLSKELRGINSLLKFDPKDSVLLKQKQELLNEELSKTKEKLDTLKEAQKLANEDPTKVSEESYRNLQREIIKTQNELKQLQVETSKWTKAGKEIEQIGIKINNVSNKLGNIGGTLTKTITPGIIGITMTAISAMDAVDEGLDTVATKTGATGDAAKELQQVYKDVGSEIPEDFGNIGAAVGEINTRLDLTGDKLKGASKDFLKFAKVNSMDVNSSVVLVTRAMGDAGIKVDDYKELLDMLTVASQKSGISIDVLATNLAKYGAPMRALGIETKQAIAMFSAWEKAGVNTEIAFSGMKKAISNWGAAGKDSTKEFNKTLEAIQKCPTIAKATSKAIEVFGAKAGPDLADAIKGGRFEFSKYVEALENGGGTLENTYSQIIDEVDDTQLAMQNLQLAMHDSGEVAAKTFGPILLDLSKDFKKLMEQFDKLDPKQKEQIIKFGLMAVAAGPLISITSKLGNVIGSTTKGIGVFSQAIVNVSNGVTTATGTVGRMTKIIAGFSNPVTLAAIGIVAAITAITVAANKANEDMKERMNNIGTSASNFYTGIETAKSHLVDFNSTIFASSEEQQKLQQNMDQIQKGITKICKKASDERRDYTAAEVKQLDEYFRKLKELKDKELEIQQNIAGAITQQAVTNAETFKGSLEEYKIQSQEWINTAQQQKDKQIEIINKGITEEIALLNMKYGSKANMDNEEYAREYNSIMQSKENKIQQANDEVAKVSEAYTNGYTKRAEMELSFLETLKQSNKKIEEENFNHTAELDRIDNAWWLTESNKRATKENENYRHSNVMKKIWEDTYKSMDESQQQQLGAWLGMLATTEIQGGKISEESKKIANSIIDNLNVMPPKTKEVMSNTMKPMLDQMQTAAPQLYAKAGEIANGILGRLQKAFDVHSPSRKTESIFKNVMLGAKLGIDQETEGLYSKIDIMSENLIEKFKSLSLKNSLGNIQQTLTDKSRTIFTTPQIIFNVNELDDAKLQQCFNYINRKFGSRY